MKTFIKKVLGRSIDLVIKKVKAHAGIEMNEIVDQVAKNRLINELSKRC